MLPVLAFGASPTFGTFNVNDFLANAGNNSITLSISVSNLIHQAMPTNNGTSFNQSLTGANSSGGNIATNNDPRFFQGTSRGQRYYVSPFGSDVNSGTNEGQAWATASNAVAKVITPCEVVFLPGNNTNDWAAPSQIRWPASCNVRFTAGAVEHLVQYTNSNQGVIWRHGSNTRNYNENLYFHFGNGGVGMFTGFFGSASTGDLVDHTNIINYSFRGISEGQGIHYEKNAGNNMIDEQWIDPIVTAADCAFQMKNTGALNTNENVRVTGGLFDLTNFTANVYVAQKDYRCVDLDMNPGDQLTMIGTTFRWTDNFQSNFPAIGIFNEANPTNAIVYMDVVLQPHDLTNVLSADTDFSNQTNSIAKYGVFKLHKNGQLFNNNGLGGQGVGTLVPLINDGSDLNNLNASNIVGTLANNTTGNAATATISVTATNLAVITNQIPNVYTNLAGIRADTGGGATVITNSSYFQNSCMLAFQVKFLTGSTAPTISTNIFGVNFNHTYNNPPIIFLTLGNGAAEALVAAAPVTIHVDNDTITTTNFFVDSGNTSLGINGTNLLNILVIGQ